MATARPTSERAGPLNGPITITIPARAAYSIESFHKVVVSLAERLGCPACLSGAHCLFQMERDFVVDPVNMKVVGLPSGGVIIDG